MGIKNRFIEHLSDQGDNHFVPWIPECAHFFTNGSTSAGAMPGLALAAWSVCLADPHSNDVACAACGTLPGGFQSNNRAELFAVVLASTAAPCGHIYTDSSYAVQGFRKLQTLGWDERHWARTDRYDLWCRLHEALKSDPLRFTIYWVPSHQKLPADVSEQDHWRALHNDAADHFAKQANKLRDPDFLLLHQSLVQQHAQFAEQQSYLVKVQKAISNVSKQCKHLVVPAHGFFQPDFAHLFREQMRMLSEDVSCP